MGTSEIGSPKWQAKLMKMKGLQKLRWYCQACEKQCRDEHGFKLHVASPSHAAKMKTANARRFEFSQTFEQQFCQLLKPHHEKLVSANKMYNELIQDRQHIHMNATRFPSLTAFIKHLESRGTVRIVAMQPELMIQYIDKDAALRKERDQKAQSQRLADEAEAEKAALEAAIASQRETVPHNSNNNDDDVDDGEEAPHSTPDREMQPIVSCGLRAGTHKREKIAFSLRKK